MNKPEREGNTLSVSLVFLWGWAILPAYLVWLTDVIQQHRLIEISRYLIATAPSIYLLAGIGINWLIEFKTLFRNLVIIHAIFAILNNTGSHLVHQREPWKQLAQVVEKSCRPDDLILVSQYYNIVCLDRYLITPHYQIGTSPNQGTSGIARQLKGINYFWLVTAQEGEVVIKNIPERFKLQQEHDFSHGLHLRLFKEYPYFQRAAE